jgi:hypothetical protein
MHADWPVIAVRDNQPQSSCQLGLPLFDKEVPPEVQAFWDTASWQSAQPFKERTAAPVDIAIDSTAIVSLGPLDDSDWQVGVGTTGLPSSRPGLFVKAKTPHEELPAGTKLLSNVRLDTVTPTESPGFTREAYVELATSSQLCYVDRTQFNALPFKLTYGRFSHKTKNKNCMWVIHDTIPDCYVLTTLQPLSTSTELYVEASWFDDPPNSIPVALRRELFTYCNTEFRDVQLTVFRSHIMALTQGIPYREREFRELYTDIPDENIRSTLGRQPRIDDPALLDRRRAKQARRRERNAKKADQSRFPENENEDSSGWSAIRQIADALRTRHSLLGGKFSELLARLNKKYNEQCDFRDDSKTVQDMLKKKTTRSYPNRGGHVDN